MTLNERIELGREIRSKGYNCAQTVVAAFTDITGLDMATSLKLASGLGFGVAGLGEICGVITGICIVVGLAEGDEKAESKKRISHACMQLSKRFMELNDGFCRCCDLKKCVRASSCNTLIEEGIEILQNHYFPSKNEKSGDCENS